MSLVPSIKGYVISERIGSGSYATVFKGFRKGNARETVAIKCLEISSLTKVDTENLLTEISLLKKFKHENIVQMHDFQWDSKYIYIIMEYCSGGDLSKFIKTRRTLCENDAKFFLQQLAKALQFLRNQNICHMDLKPQNILLTYKSGLVLKLADFGFAQYLKPQDDCSSIRGSPLYMAPEILLLHKYDAGADLWSVGIILYECLFGRAPFSSNTFAELIEKIKDPRPIQIPYGVRISLTCRDLVERLLQRDPKQRITYNDFFTHPFLALKFMPSSESYSKASETLVEAVKEDGKKNYESAVQLYCDGLQYLMAAVQYEQDKNRKDAMRKKAHEYICRAECLKLLVKSKSNAGSTSQENPSQELVQLSLDSTPLQNALSVGSAAEQLHASGQLEAALNKYFIVLDTMLSILAEEPPGKRKELIGNQIRLWVENAETIERALSMDRLRTSVDAPSVLNSDTDSQCNIQ